MDLHDVELGHVPYPSDAPPSPNALSDNPPTNSTSDNYMRTASGKKIDRRLCVFIMVAVFTLALMAFSMVMLCIGRSESVWLPVMTFAVGVWTGQLPTNTSSAKSPRGSPAP